MNTKPIIESDGESISPDEFFHFDYRSFIDATRVLAANSLDQCEWMGDYNVAWEIKDDVSAGRHLVGRGKLVLESERQITDLVATRTSMPAYVLHAATGRASNLNAMNHASWEPIRAQAAALREALRLITEQNAAFLGLPSSTP